MVLKASESKQDNKELSGQKQSKGENSEMERLSQHLNYLGPEVCAKISKLELGSSSSWAHRLKKKKKKSQYKVMCSVGDSSPKSCGPRRLHLLEKSLLSSNMGPEKKQKKPLVFTKKGNIIS